MTSQIFILSVFFQDEMTNALATMRVDHDTIRIKEIGASTNPLLMKRRKKEAALGTIPSEEPM